MLHRVCNKTFTIGILLLQRTCDSLHVNFIRFYHESLEINSEKLPGSTDFVQRRAFQRITKRFTAVRITRNNRLASDTPITFVRDKTCSNIK